MRKKYKTVNFGVALAKVKHDGEWKFVRYHLYSKRSMIGLVRYLKKNFNDVAYVNVVSGGAKVGGWRKGNDEIYWL